MGTAGENGGRQSHPQIRLDAVDNRAGHDKPLLLPVSPGWTIDEITARVVESNRRQVELLVPNGTKALQSVAGCETLRRAAERAALRVTLFTADEQTIAAANVTQLDVIPIGSAVAVPRAPSTRPIAASPSVSPFGNGEPASSSQELSSPAPARQAPPIDHPVAPAPDERLQPTNGRTQDAVHPRSAEDADFLASLEAFEQAQAGHSPPMGQTLATDEGAILFDAPGDLGLRRPMAAEQEAWENAFDDMAATMASEPEPAPHPRERRPVREGPRREEARREPARGRFGSLPPILTRRRAAMKEGAEDGYRSTPARPGPSAPGSPRRRARSPLFWPLAALALIALLGGGWLALTQLGLGGIGLGGGTLTLIPPAPKTEATPVAGVAIPVRPDPVTDQSSFDVQGLILEQPVVVAVAGQAISTTLTPIGRATGLLLLRNTLSQPVTIRAGTPVPAANGVQFTVAGNATVSAAVSTLDGVTYGRGEVSLVATVPGAAGNIPPGSITSIPGFEGTLRVDQGEFSGGSDQEVRIVRTEDVNRVLPEAVSRLYGTGVQQLQAEVNTRPGFQLSQAVITPTLESLQQLSALDYAVFPPIGAVTQDGTFQLEVRARFQAVAEPTDAPLQQQLQQAVRNQLVNTGKIAPDAQVQIGSWRIANGGLSVDATVTPAGKVPALSQDFLQQVQTAIAGKPRDEATRYLQSLVDEGRIQQFSPIPPSWETIPTRVNVRQSTP